VNRGKADGRYDQNGYAPNKWDEVFVVALANTGAKPWAVMVEPLNTSIADATVDGSWWSVNITRRAVFDFGKSAANSIEIFAAINGECFLREIVLFIFVNIVQEFLKKYLLGWLVQETYPHWNGSRILACCDKE